MKSNNRVALTNKQRFEQKFNKGLIDDCWEWQGHINKYGYGEFSVRVDPLINRYNYSQAHRVSYELYNGPITQPVIRHTCHNKRCVNPNHLLQGTHKDNGQDMVLAGRSLFGERNLTNKLSEYQIMKLWYDFDNHYYKGFYNDKAIEYGVAYQTIHRICHRKGWEYLQKKEWRSFRTDSVISFEIVEEK